MNISTPKEKKLYYLFAAALRRTAVGMMIYVENEVLKISGFNLIITPPKNI
jgi:hypothetical protein